MYACSMHACMHACVYMYVCLCAVYTYLSIYLSISIYICRLVYLRMLIVRHPWLLRAHKDIYVYIHTYICICHAESYGVLTYADTWRHALCLYVDIHRRCARTCVFEYVLADGYGMHRNGLKS